MDCQILVDAFLCGEKLSKKAGETVLEHDFFLWFVKSYRLLYQYCILEHSILGFLILALVPKLLHYSSPIIDHHCMEVLCLIKQGDT